MATMTDKALRAIREDRVRVVKANAAGIALDVEASKPDADTLGRPTYRVVVYVKGGRIVRRCSCPSVKKCYHVAIAELLWAPGPHEVSDR